MPIVKLPKKLRDAFKLITWGETEEGIAAFEKILGFEHQKAIALSEIAYFNHNFEKAIELDTQALLHHDEWYAGNIVHEHLSALIYAGKHTENKTVVETFINTFHDLPFGQINEKKRQMDLDKLNASIPSNKYTEAELPEEMSYFLEQLKKYRPKFSPDSADASSYMLHAIYEKGRANDFISLYEKYYKEISYATHHIRAAKIYVALGEIEKAQKTILYYAEHVWYPVEYIQVAPMTLWLEDDLISVLTKDLCLQILQIKKASGLK